MKDCPDFCHNLKPCQRFLLSRTPTPRTAPRIGSQAAPRAGGRRRGGGGGCGGRSLAVLPYAAIYLISGMSRRGPSILLSELPASPRAPRMASRDGALRSPLNSRNPLERPIRLHFNKLGTSAAIRGRSFKKLISAHAPYLPPRARRRPQGGVDGAIFTRRASPFYVGRCRVVCVVACLRAALY